MAATNVNTNKIHIGEVVLQITDLTDTDGSPLLFTTLTSSTVEVYDILGNTIAPTITQGDTVSSLKYEVDTNTLREGEITARVVLERLDTNLVSGTAKDIIIQELFTLYK